MQFKQFLENENLPAKIAKAIANLYAQGKESLDTLFDRMSPKELQNQVYEILKDMIKNGQLKLRPGRYNPELQPYAPPPQVRQPEFTAQERKVLAEVEPVVQKVFSKWLAEKYPEGHDENEKLDALREFLEEKYSIGIRPDGLMTFWQLNNATRKIVGDHDVAVYHYTTTALDSRIKKHGLLGYGNPGVKKVNAHLNSGAGVYVTTEINGPAVEQYYSQAIAKWGGSQRVWVIKTKLNRLLPDPDDADIESGKYQFVLPFVSPRDLVEAA